VIGRGRLWLDVLLIAALAGGMALGGCTAGPPAISDDVDERSEAMALAWNLLSQNREVAGILSIKGTTPGTKALIEEIAAASDAAADTLERVARAEGMPLEDDGLPAAEVRVRAAIRARVSRELLFSSGRAFERTLLLTQVEALGYASDLLEEVAARLRATDLPEDAEEIRHEAAAFAALRVRVVDRLRIASDGATAESG